MHLLAASGGAGDAIGTVFAVVMVFVIYWIPAGAAFVRGIPGKGQVVVVNLFLGWTVIGWVIALVMAFRHVPETPAVSR